MFMYLYIIIYNDTCAWTPNIVFVDSANAHVASVFCLTQTRDSRASCQLHQLCEEGDAL